MKILVGCEMSGIVRNAFIKKGHEAISCDLMSSLRGQPHHKGDLLDFARSQHWDMLIAFPPCTYLSVISNGHTHNYKEQQKKERNQKKQQAIAFVRALWQLPIKFIALENPVGSLSTRFKKPTQIVQPYQFGHKVQKRTCFWLKNLPKLESTKNVELQMRLETDRKLRRHVEYGATAHGYGQRMTQINRSMTFQGIADAMAEQWGNL